MFRKLLRYDLKAVRGLWLGQAAIVLAMSIPAGLVMRFLNSEYDSHSAVYEGLATFFVSVYVLWLVGSYVMVQYGIYHHFYKNFYTDEGYLTFTLPVSRKQLLLSKVANAIILSAAQVLLYLLAALIVMLLSAVPKDGAILSNSGHFDVEIDKVALEAKSKRVWTRKPNIQGFEMADGRIINLMAEGRLVNLAAGNGHPAEIMDMSFAIQSLCLEYLAKNGRELKNKLYPVPAEIDAHVAQIKLEAMGRAIDVLTPEQFEYLNS